MTFVDYVYLEESSCPVFYQLSFFKQQPDDAVYLVIWDVYLEGVFL